MCSVGTGVGVDVYRCWHITRNVFQITTLRWQIVPVQVRAASNFQVMAFKVTLKTPSGEQVIECSGDTYILDAAEEAGEY